MPPMHSTLELLMALLLRAAASFSTVAAYTPQNLLAMIPTPMPVPQNSIPRAASPPPLGK